MNLGPTPPPAETERSRSLMSLHCPLGGTPAPHTSSRSCPFAASGTFASLESVQAPPGASLDTPGVRLERQQRQSWQLISTLARSELRGCVKVEVAVLGSLSLISLMVSVDVEIHWTRTRTFPQAERIPLGGNTLGNVLGGLTARNIANGKRYREKKEKRKKRAFLKGF